MKAGREHRVPLCARAVELLERAAKASTTGSDQGWIFPGQQAGRPISNMAFTMLLRRMGRTEITTHGFRSAFRDWAGETTDTPREIAEAALAHTVGNETERAYRRGDSFEKRRQLMERWGEFVEKGGA